MHAPYKTVSVKTYIVNEKKLWNKNETMEYGKLYFLFDIFMTYLNFLRFFRVRTTTSKTLNRRKRKMYITDCFFNSYSVKRRFQLNNNKKNDTNIEH